MAILTIEQLKTELGQNIRTNGVEAISGAVLNAFLEDLIDSILNVGTMQSFIGTNPPNVSTGAEGDIYFQKDKAVYRKTSGVWMLAIRANKTKIMKSDTDIKDTSGDQNWYVELLDEQGNPFPEDTLPVYIFTNNVQMDFTFDPSHDPPRVYGFSNNLTQTIKIYVQ